MSNSLIQCYGYKIFRLDRKVLNLNGQPKVGGGICAFVHKDVAVVSNSHAEITNLGIQKKGNMRFVLNAICRPPAGNVDVSTKILDQTMYDTLAEVGGDTFLLGDLNLDFNHVKNSQIKN